MSLILSRLSACESPYLRKSTCFDFIVSQEDIALAKALAASEKTIAENLMIVDLVRNDLGRVCQVRVKRNHRLSEALAWNPHAFDCKTLVTADRIRSSARAHGGRNLRNCTPACHHGEPSLYRNPSW